MREWIVTDKDLGCDGQYFDYEELIRCKDCIWYEIYELKSDGTIDRRYKPSFCYNYREFKKETDFCSEGKRYKNER